MSPHSATCKNASHVVVYRCDCHISSHAKDTVICRNTTLDTAPHATYRSTCHLIPPHAITCCHILTYTVTYRHLPLQPPHTLTYHRMPSHIITCRQIPSHNITCRNIPSHVITWCHISSRAITHHHMSLHVWHLYIREITLRDRRQNNADRSH